MTSTDDRLGTDPLLTATAGDVERGIARELFRHGLADEANTAYAAMAVVGPVLEAKDAEITRLRAVTEVAAGVTEKNAAGECVTVLEVAARASERVSERVRCAALLDSLGFTDAADALTSRPAARAADVRERNRA